MSFDHAFAIDALVANAPPNSALAVVPLHFAGCLAAADDPEKALGLLHRASASDAPQPIPPR
jgi:hypothetical protein